MDNLIVIVTGSIAQILSTLFMLRLYMRFCQIGAQAPLARLVAKTTNPFTRWIQPFLPTVKRFDIPALTLAVLVLFVQISAVLWFEYESFNLGVIAKITFAKSSTILLDLIFFAVLARVILSWVTPGEQSDISLQLFNPLTDAVLEPVRRIIPSIGMIDLSPLIVLLSIQMLDKFIINLIS